VTTSSAIARHDSKRSATRRKDYLRREPPTDPL
jgi:hypothetical protein